MSAVLNTPATAASPQRRWRKIATGFIAWLYVLVGLCLVPFCAVVVVLALLGAVPQAQEVLYSLTETGSGGLARMAQMAFILVAQVLFSVLVWYCARLLCTIDAVKTIPPVLRKPSNPAVLRHAVTWVPRLLGYGAAAALSYVLVRAASASFGMDAMLVLAAMFGLSIALPCLQHRYPRARVFSITLGLCSVFLLGFVVGIGTRVYWFMLVEALFPATLMLALDTRREWMQVVFRLKPGPAASSHSLHTKIGRISILFGIGAAGAALLTLLPARLAGPIGPAAVVLLTIVVMLLLLTPFTLVLRRLFCFAPGWPAFVTGLVLAGMVWQGRPQYGEERLAALPVPAGESPSPAAVASKPVQSFAVNAHGGGLRAALFTGMVLARLDDATCGRFGEGLVAASGVSGGSVGIGMYLALRQDFVARGGWKCSTPTLQNPAPLTSLVQAALGQDHLSPVVARLAFHDLFLHGLNATRGQALLDSWQAAAVASFERSGMQGGTAAIGLARPLKELTGGLARPPAVYFNATEAHGGRIAVFRAGGAGTFQLGDGAAQETGATVGEAILHSARFPLVSPPGRFRAGAHSYALLDGGYIDNSGATTLLTVLQSMAGSGPEGGLIVLNIDGNPPEYPCGRALLPNNDLGLEFSSLLNVRTANAAAAVERLKDSPMAREVIDIRYDLATAFDGGKGTKLSEDEVCGILTRQRQAPLGWMISAAAQSPMAISALAGVGAVCQRMTGQCRTAPAATLAGIGGHAAAR